MDRLRYVFGVLLVIGVPPALVWWFVVHPFVTFWRRVGAGATLTIVATGALVLGTGLFQIRDSLLGRDLGTVPLFWPVAAILTGSAVWIGWKRRAFLTTRILAGVPELQADGKGGTLLNQGIYSVIRNPRYVEVALGTFAYAAFANFVGAWVIAVATLPGLHLIVLLEERELTQRFGPEFEEYMRTVPRYLPRRRASGTRDAAF